MQKGTFTETLVMWETFAGTLVNVREVLVNMTLWVRQSSPNFANVRDQKINANFFWTKFFENPAGHGRPPRKSWTSALKSAFSCGPSGGRNFLTPGHLGVRVRNVRRKFGPECLCLCCFSSLKSSHESAHLLLVCHGTCLIHSLYAMTSKITSLGLLHVIVGPSSSPKEEAVQVSFLDSQ